MSEPRQMLPREHPKSAKYRIKEIKCVDGTIFDLDVRKRFLFWDYWSNVNSFSDQESAEKCLSLVVEKEKKTPFLSHYDAQGRETLP